MVAPSEPILAPDGSAVPAGDVEVLRRLAGRKLEIADHPQNLERRDLWYRHDAGEPVRPVVLALNRGGAQLLNARDAVDGVLDRLGDEHLHLLRRQAWRLGLYSHLRRSKLGKDVVLGAHN